MSFLHTEWRNPVLVVGGAAPCAVLATVMSSKVLTPTATRLLENVAARYENGIFLTTFTQTALSRSAGTCYPSITKCPLTIVTKYLFPTGQLLPTERR